MGQANVAWNLGLYFRNQDKLDQAEPYLAQAVELGNQIAPGHPTTVGWENVLAEVQTQLSNISSDEM